MKPTIEIFNITITAERIVINSDDKAFKDFLKNDLQIVQTEKKSEHKKENGNVIIDKLGRKLFVPEKICPECGKKYQPTSNGQKRCPECTKNRIIEKKKTLNQRF